MCVWMHVYACVCICVFFISMHDYKVVLLYAGFDQS